MKRVRSIIGISVAVTVLSALVTTASGAEPGDLDRRLQISASRLGMPDFTSKSVFAINKNEWPGDVPGRVILAWTVLAEATGKEPEGLKPFVDSLPSQFNAKGYFGPIQDTNAINEQQISGHGWLLSGLCRYAAYSGDQRVLEWARNIVKEVALPLAGKYRQYPRTPDDRNKAGAASGNLTGRVINDWKVSTDIGCCFIFLEGLVAANRAIPSPELQSLIEEAAESFLDTDVRAVQAQTHASLCAARNLLLYEESSGMRHGWLPKIQAIYQAYRTEAMTENEANWNWFGRPSWTEPCAIVDSFLLAMELWRVTGQAEYLNDAQRIFYNGLGYGQKPGGGFGCDIFSGLGIRNRHWDVPWCCDMRGAVGLAGAMMSRTRQQGDMLQLPFYANGVFHVGGWNITEQTAWPLRGEVNLAFKKDAAAPAVERLGFFIPAECTPGSVKILIDGRATGVSGQVQNGFVTITLPQRESFEVRMQMDLPLRAEPPHNISTRKDVVTLRHGFLLLGTPDGQTLPSVRLEDFRPLGDGRYGVKGSEMVLSPLSQMPFSQATKEQPWRTQVLFQLAK